jgi:hypothetical protein
MKCRKVEKLLSDYLDGEVKEKEKELIRAHLSECPACRKEFEFYKKSEELIRLKIKEEPLPGFWERCWPELKAKLEPLYSRLPDGQGEAGKKSLIPRLIDIPLKLLRQPLFIGATASAVILVLALNLVSLNHKYRELEYIFQQEIAKGADYQPMGIESFLQALATSQMREEVELMEEALSRFPQAELYLEEVVAESFNFEQNGIENGGELL